MRLTAYAVFRITADAPWPDGQQNLRDARKWIDCNRYGLYHSPMPNLRIINLVFFVVNIALFALWFSMIRMDALPERGGTASYALSEITLIVTILGVMIGLGALLLAGLGFIGFRVVLERAEIQADKTAREVLNRLWNDCNDVGDSKVRIRRRQLPDVGAATGEGDL